MAEEKIILTLEANDEASQKLERMAKALRDIDKEASDVGNSSASGISKLVSNIESNVKKVNNLTRQYNNAMSGFNRAVINTVKDMGSAVYDFTTDSIDNFTKFSEQHAKTLGAMAADYDKTAESQARFFQDAQKLKDQALQIGTYGVNNNGALMNVSDVSSAQTELIKAGVSSNDIVNSNVTADVLEFAQANDLDTASAVEFAVTLGNQFGVKQADWGLMLDKVSHTADMSIIDVKDIVQSMKWAGGITSGLDRSLEETLGLISMLGDFGLKGSQAGTGIQALLSRLLTGDTTVITQAQAEVAPGNALEKFYEFEKIAKPDGNLLPMADIIDELNATMEDMTDEEQAWFAKKLFGLYQMKSAYALLNGDDTDLNDVIKEITEQSEGTNENKLNQLLESQYGQLTSLGNLWEGVKTDVGDRLSPFVDAVRDELFTFLSNDGNYEINFDNLRTALDESCNLIEEKYGSAIANSVRGIGDFTIDLTQVAEQLAPELGTGLLEMLSSAFDGDFFGKGGAFDDWGTMIDNMHESADELPEDLRDLGNAVVSTIDWFGKLVAFNVVSEIAQLISSVLQILTVAGGAVINVAGAVVVNGAGAGGTGASIAGATGAGASSALKGSTTVGSADDVAKALGTTADDVVATLGKQASYTIDDIASGLGTSSDDIINALGGSIDDVAKGASGLWGSLSKVGKGLGVAGIALQVGTSGYEAINDFTSGDTKGGLEAIGGGAGSIGGSIGLAALGTSIAPGIGTVIGAILGGVGGDKLARGIVDNMYDNISSSKSRRESQQQRESLDESRRSAQESRYGIKPSDFGLPKIFDSYYNGKTGEIPWDSIVDELQLAKDYPLAWGRKESEYGMNVDEAKSWQDSEAYQQYITALNGAKDALVATQEELESKMVTIKKGDTNYNPSLDTEGRGHYSVWTGSQEELDKYLEGKSFISNSNKSDKGLISNPYMIEDLPNGVKNSIIPSTSSKVDSTTPSKPANTNDVTLNTGTTNLVGNLVIPDIGSIISQIMSKLILNRGDNQSLIDQQIDNQIQIDDSITMQPHFTVSAPNVNVDVKVDKDNRVTSQTSILNPGQGTILDNWYSRTSSQYGKTNK